MGRITEFFDTAHGRSQANSWLIAGALLPHEAYELLQLAPGAQLIDVRSHAELELNGEEIDEFAACILDGGRPETAGEEGLAALAVIEAITKSAESNRPVEIKEIL